MEREEPVTFFGSIVVCTAVVGGPHGRRMLAPTETVARQEPSTVGGWGALAERVVARSWEHLQASGGERPIFRRPLR